MRWSDAFTSFGPGRKAPIGGLADLGLTGLLRQYKRVTASRYRVISPTELRDRGPQGRRAGCGSR